MIYCVVPRGQEFGIRNYLKRWGERLIGRVATLNHEDLCKPSVPAGAYVFMALDQLTPPRCGCFPLGWPGQPSGCSSGHWVIHVLVPREQEFGILGYVNLWGREFAKQFLHHHYEQLPQRASPPAGTYIFTGLDSAHPAGRERVGPLQPQARSQ